MAASEDQAIFAAVRDKIKYYSKLLEHASTCLPSWPCIADCTKMHAHIDHSRMCLLTDCKRCLRLKMVTRFHAHHCRAGQGCPVQGCRDLVAEE